jgi:hypothetical protein
VGYNERDFFPLWDTTEKFFSAVGYNGEGFSYVVGYNRRGFFLMWDTTENNLRMTNKFCSIVSHMQEIFLPLYPTPQQNLVQCTVSQKIFSIVSHNAAGFLPLYPTMEDIFLTCGIQWKKLSSIVEYNGRGFFRCGIQWKKNIQHAE